jgi:hypothetical protein
MTIRRAVCRRTEKKDNGGDILQIYLLETIEIDTSSENKAHREGERKTIEEKIAFFSLAGSYAQLTLLGQPKHNSTSTQKIIPAENQNGRIQFRANTQTSIPERSNSTASTHSIQPTVDTKKARDNYERILKQLEVSIAALLLRLITVVSLAFLFSSSIAESQSRSQSTTRQSSEP